MRNLSRIGRLAAVTMLLSALPNHASARPGISNVGMDALDVKRDGSLVALLVYEGRQGSTDLNGDGDATDFLVHVYDASRDTMTVVRTGAQLGQLKGNLLTFDVSEQRENMDLNGDGDSNDRSVLHLHDVQTGMTVNTGFAARWSELAGNQVILAVDEWNSGFIDLNGDGDANDSVHHLFDAASMTSENLRTSGSALWFGQGLLAISAREGPQGQRRDLNGDGDISDNVLHIYDTGTGALTNLGLAVGFANADGNYLSFTVLESSQAATDFNGDGDTADAVLHLYDAASSSITNLSLPFAGVPHFDEAVVAFAVSESGQGDSDLNGDGDADDRVLFMYDLAARTLTNLQFAVPYDPELRDGLLVFSVYERDQAMTDLNGDGDTWDGVLHVYDVASGALQNVGLSGVDYHIDGKVVAFNVSETAEGRTDLNGDGDTSDSVLHVFDASRAETTNLGLDRVRTGQENLFLDGSLLAFTVREQRQGDADLNRDGDALDDVLHFFDTAAAITTNSELAAYSVYRVDGNWAVFTVYERYQDETDLNGDLDVHDTVLHVADGLSVFVPDLVRRLTSTVRGLDLEPPFSNKLTAQLNLALAMFTDGTANNDVAGIAALGHFVDRVEESRGGGISEADAEALIVAASDILARL